MLAIAVAFGLPSAAQAVVPGCTVRGRVVRADTGAPLRDVDITIDETTKKTRSDLDGHFELGGLAPDRHTLEARLEGFASQAHEVDLASECGQASVLFELAPLAKFLSEVVVTPSRYTLYESRPDLPTTLSRQDVTRMPHFSDDPFRAVRWLPGTSGEDLSSQVIVRGGETGETLVLLDGLEIQEGFHLKELFSLLSIIDSETLGGLEFMSGGFPVQYGNRMSAVIDMTSSDSGPPRGSLAVSTTNFSALSEGTFDDGRGRWLASARLTDLGMVIDWVDPDSGLEPSFYDAFAKVSYRLGGRTTVAAEALGSNDTTHYTDTNGGGFVDEMMDASSSNVFAWLHVDTAWSPRLRSKTVLSTGRVTAKRQGDIDYWYQEGTVNDARSFDVLGIRQDWSLEIADRHVVSWGLDARRQEATYDYTSHSVVRDPLFLVGGGSHVTDRDEQLRPSGNSYTLYVADRFRLSEPLVVELGARWDRQTYTAKDDQLSPRATLSCALDPRTTMRAAWGVFYQAQGINDLQVVDGITTFWPAQRAEHRLLSLERELSNDLDLRVEVYQKKLTDVRPHYENLLNPIEIFPEIESDRILVAPERSEAAGVEVTLRRGGSHPLTWWLSYAWSKAEDRIDGEWVPRSWDQPHAVNFSLNYRPNERWNLNLSGAFHTGWPTTGITGEIRYDDNGNVYLIPHLGQRNDERLPYYLRIDSRLSRDVRLRHGNCSIFFEVMNLLNRENLSRPESFSFRNRPDGTVDVIVEWEGWTPIIPSLGIRWTF